MRVVRAFLERARTRGRRPRTQRATRPTGPLLPLQGLLVVPVSAGYPADPVLFTRLVAGSDRVVPGDPVSAEECGNECSECPARRLRPGHAGSEPARPGVYVCMMTS